MSGRPKVYGDDSSVCSGYWAGHTADDDRHCVCWWDDRGGVCCQCGADPREPDEDTGYLESGPVVEFLAEWDAADTYGKGSAAVERLRSRAAKRDESDGRGI